jgi:hypothetical protein
MTKELIRFGIDPGKHTGISTYSPKTKRLISCETTGIVKAMSIVGDHLYSDHYLSIEVWFEDARQRKWIPKKSGRERLQGAGSIKRDCTIWEEFCKYHKIPYRMFPPKQLKTKLNAEKFKMVTGWSGRTSEHARDSAMIVFGS